MSGRLKYWGWGLESEGLSGTERDGLLSTLAADFEIRSTTEGRVPGITDIDLPDSRLAIPHGLSRICTGEPYERILHSFGQSQPDSIASSRETSPTLPTWWPIRGTSRIWWPCSSGPARLTRL